MILALSLVGCADYGNSYRPSPHEIWNFQYSDYGKNNEELGFGSGTVVKYVKYNGGATVTFVDDLDKKTKTITLGKEDFFMITVAINYDILGE